MRRSGPFPGVREPRPRSGSRTAAHVSDSNDLLHARPPHPANRRRPRPQHPACGRARTCGCITGASTASWRRASRPSSPSCGPRGRSSSSPRASAGGWPDRFATPYRAPKARNRRVSDGACRSAGTKSKRGAKACLGSPIDSTTVKPWAPVAWHVCSGFSPTGQARSTPYPAALPRRDCLAGRRWTGSRV